jgi:molybdate transport system substrate-binding protein
VKLRFVSAGAAQALVAATAQRDGVEVEGSFGAVGSMLQKYRDGAACDIVILTRRQIDQLVEDGRVRGETIVDLGAVPTSIAVRDADPSPDVSTAQQLRDAVEAAEAIYFPDPDMSTAGIHFEQVLQKLGIHERISDRIRNFPNGATAMREMAKSTGHVIGCTQATEIRATPGVKLVAPLPKGLDLVTVYSGAVDAAAAQHEAAARFLKELAGKLA